MKAIHNIFCEVKFDDYAVFDMSKIKNESNSQQLLESLPPDKGCI